MCRPVLFGHPHPRPKCRRADRAVRYGWTHGDSRGAETDGPPPEGLFGPGGLLRTEAAREGSEGALKDLGAGRSAQRSSISEIVSPRCRRATFARHCPCDRTSHASKPVRAGVSLSWVKSSRLTRTAPQEPAQGWNSCRSLGCTPCLAPRYPPRQEEHIVR